MNDVDTKPSTVHGSTREQITQVKYTTSANYLLLLGIMYRSMI